MLSGSSYDNSFVSIVFFKKAAHVGTAHARLSVIVGLVAQEPVQVPPDLRIALGTKEFVWLGEGM
jgi:hypothetical protein